MHELVGRCAGQAVMCMNWGGGGRCAGQAVMCMSWWGQAVMCMNWGGGGAMCRSGHHAHEQVGRCAGQAVMCMNWGGGGGGDVPVRLSCA